MIRKQKRAGAVLMALLLALLAGCGTEGAQSSQPQAAPPSSASSPQENAGNLPAAYSYAQEDLDAQWDEDAATAITLTGDSASVEGSGASAEGSAVTISEAGTYLLRGTLDDGQIVIDAGAQDTVRVVLDNVSLKNSSTAPFYAKQAGKVILTLAAGSENEIADAAEYQFADPAEDEPDAAVFVKDSLTINGTGSLTVAGNYRNGIASKDDLAVVSGNLTVSAVNDAVRGRDSVVIRDGNLTLDSGADGIKSNNGEDAEKGWILIDGGAFAISAGNDGIQAETALAVNGGSFSVITGGGSASSAKHSDQGLPGDARDGLEEDDGGAESQKALKAGTALSIAGGTFTIDAADDAVHSNGSVTVDGGAFSIKTGDDAFHADGALTVNDGAIAIETCYEGLEGQSVSIYGGEITLSADDDGINAADGAAAQNRPGQGNPNCRIAIYGGVVSVTTKGDGIDSNGDFLLEGGTLIVNGPSAGADSPLDFDGTAAVNGGLLAAAGGAGMFQSPGDGSAQRSLTVVFDTVQKAGTLLSLTDGDGGVLIAFAPEADYQAVVFSSPELTEGKTVAAVTGGSISGESQNGCYPAGTLTGGTELFELMLESVSARVNQNGEAVSGGFFDGGRGAMGGPGGGMAGHGGGRGGGPGQRPEGFGGAPSGGAPDGLKEPPGGMEAVTPGAPGGAEAGSSAAS